VSASALTALWNSNEPVVAPGIFDPLGARIVEDLGFEAVYLGGWATGAHLTTTEPLLSLTEQVEVARRITKATRLPLLVDGDAGFGDPLHAGRTVEEFEEAGVAGIHIEDQVFPKRAAYHRGLEYVTDRRLFLDKIKVAVAARASTDFRIIARTDAASAANGDWNEAVWRSSAALDLGADAVMPLVPNEEVRDRIREHLPADSRVVVLAGYEIGQHDLSIDEYVRRGYRVIIYPVPGVIFAAGAVWSLYSSLKRDSVVPSEGRVGIDVADYASMQDRVERLIGLPKYWALEELYLPSTPDVGASGE